MRLRYKLLLGAAGFFTLNFVCKSLNGNFDPAELLKPSRSGSVWDTSSEKNAFDIESLLSQEFRYLGKGHQAFAFVSADDKYVLKLFKPHYPHLEFWGESFNFTFIPFSKLFYRLAAKDAFNKRIADDFTSYVNAYNTFKEESLVEYLHLADTSHLKKRLKLFDKIGILRNFDPNTTCFLVQRKVEPLQDVLRKLQKENKIEEIKTVMQGLLGLLSKRVEKRFYKPTHKFHANFGCVGLKPIQLDIGNLLTPEDLKLVDYTLPKDLNISLKKLRVWLNDHFPELKEELEEVIHNYPGASV